MNSQRDSPQNQSSLKLSKFKIIDTDNFDCNRVRTLIKSTINDLINQNQKNKNKYSSKDISNLEPEILSLFKILKLQQELYDTISETVIHREELVHFYFDILLDHSDLILDFQSLTDLILYKNNIIADQDQSMILYLEFLCLQFSSEMTQEIYFVLEKLLVSFFVLSSHSEYSRCMYIRLFNCINKFMETDIYQVLLSICEICKLPRLKASLLDLKRKFEVFDDIQNFQIKTNRDSKNRFVISEFPVYTEKNDNDNNNNNHNYNYKFNNIQNNNNSYSTNFNESCERLINACLNSESRQSIHSILFKTKTNRFITKDIQKIRLSSNSTNLYTAELFRVLNTCLETVLETLNRENFSTETQCLEARKEVYLQLTVIFNSVGQFGSMTDVKLEDYFGVLDSLSSTFEDWESALCFVRLLPLSIDILRESEVRGSFQEIVEDTLLEIFNQQKTLNNNPVLVFEALRAYVVLLKNKIIRKPSPDLRKVLKQHQTIYLSIIKGNTSRENINLDNNFLTQKSIKFRLTSVFETLSEYKIN